MIPYARHTLDQADRDAVLRVLESDRLTQGEQVDAFEEEFAKKVQAPYAVAFSSGTAALHASCHVAGIGKGNRVITSPLGFVASANAPKYLGAGIEFADIADDWNIDIVEAFLPVIPVHFAGYPFQHSKELRERSKVPIIEDACHALGARTESGPVGNCAYSDFCCFSFHPSKSITTAEGGMVTCRTKANAKALKRFRNHGFTFQGGHRRDQVELGYNYRMSDIHAALGRSQLPKLEGFIARRHAIAGRYLQELNGVVKLPPYSPHHAWHLFVIRTPARDAVYEALRKRGIETQVHYRPIYQNTFHSGEPLPNVEAYYREALSIPIYPSLSEDEQTEVIEAIRDVV